MVKYSVHKIENGRVGGVWNGDVHRDWKCLNFEGFMQLPKPDGKYIRSSPSRCGFEEPYITREEDQGIITIKNNKYDLNKEFYVEPNYSEK